jgi:hypothetical protein
MPSQKKYSNVSDAENPKPPSTPKLKKDLGSPSLCCQISMFIFAVSLLSLIAYIPYMYYEYYESTMEYRHDIDISNTSIYHPLLDKGTDEHIDCTPTKPCKFTCEYVEKHFHQTMGDCEYDDYLTPITVFVIIYCLCICRGCFAAKDEW